VTARWSRNGRAEDHQHGSRQPRAEREAARHDDDDAGEIAWVPHEPVRPGRDQMVAALGLDAHDRREEAIDRHRPQRRRIAGRHGDEPRSLEPGRHAVAPVQAAAVEPRDDPMQNQHQREQAQRQRRAPAAGTPTLHEKPGVEERQGDRDHGRENCDVDPERRDACRAGRSKQRDRDQRHEQSGLDVGRKGHEQLRVEERRPVAAAAAGGNDLAIWNQNRRGGVPWQARAGSWQTELGGTSPFFHPHIREVMP